MGKFALELDNALRFEGAQIPELLKDIAYIDFTGGYAVGLTMLEKAIQGTTTSTMA